MVHSVGRRFEIATRFVGPNRSPAQDRCVAELVTAGARLRANARDNLQGRNISARERNIQRILDVRGEGVVSRRAGKGGGDVAERRILWVTFLIAFK